jgi:hypothetical protein
MSNCDPGEMGYPELNTLEPLLVVSAFVKDMNRIGNLKSKPHNWHRPVDCL